MDCVSTLFPWHGAQIAMHKPRFSPLWSFTRESYSSVREVLQLPSTQSHFVTPNRAQRHILFLLPPMVTTVVSEKNM